MARIRLVFEAAALLLLARIAIEILPFKTLCVLVCQPRFGRQVHGRAGESSGRIAWALAAAARRVPGRITCLTEAFAAQAMLRRHGHASEVRLGVLKPGDRPSALDGHAWVECEGRIIVGDTGDVADYSIVTCFAA